MTSDSAVWDLYSPMFADHERAVNPSMVSFFRGNSLFGSVTTSTPWTCDVNYFVAKLPLTVHIDSLATGCRKGNLKPEILADRWHISLDRAKETLEATTHLAVCERGPNMPSIRLHPLSCQLQFWHLVCRMFVDLAVMNVTSLRGNRYALVVCTSFRWTGAFPLKKKSDGHEGLDLLHRQVGVPAKMIADGGGEFMKEFASKASPQFGGGCNSRAEAHTDAWLQRFSRRVVYGTIVLSCCHCSEIIPQAQSTRWLGRCPR
jgi:hypothetical protein